MIPDHRKRPWRKLRVVVEVTVPPTSRATEKDLEYYIQQHMPYDLGLPREEHPSAYRAVVRTKKFTSFWPVFLRLEKGLKVGRPKEKR